MIQRDIDRAACFFSDEDRQVYLDALGGLARSGGVAIHAYVLMTHHVHLLLTASAQPNLSALMKGLGQRYVQYVNRTYHRTGTLWEGRFRSCLIEAENYFLACQRDVELNPVRAGMVPDPAAYPLVQLQRERRRATRSHDDTPPALSGVVVCLGQRVVGYYCLAAGSLLCAEGPGRVRRNMPDPIPVMILGRLAVDRAWQGQGLGSALLRDAVLRILNAAEIAGVRAILVHAISEEAKHFYESHDFMESPANPMTLVVTLKDIRAALDL